MRQARCRSPDGDVIMPTSVPDDDVQQTQTQTQPHAVRSCGAVRCGMHATAMRHGGTRAGPPRIGDARHTGRTTPT
ncbi:hypothetical protein BBJ41_27205 [Burkholderia stabilis]|nr:hypothetical protein BBJ41_27205 [Burkholderia stabilis]